MFPVVKSWLKNQAGISIRQPLSKEVENNNQDYLAQSGTNKLGWRHFRKAIQFGLSGQSKYLCQKIEPSWKRVLWIYEGIPQIGDALMDLAPRSLLHQEKFDCDLLIDNHLAPLFQSDPWFNHIESNPQLLAGKTYDFIILQSNKRRSMRTKMRYFRSTYWISMHGFYTGPEFNRANFATQRLADLLATSCTDVDFETHARQKLCPLPPRSSPKNSDLKIAFALGGVDSSRVYEKWVELALALHSFFKITITLIGSSNAHNFAVDFLEHLGQKIQVRNLVAKISITETRDAIAAQDLVIACDGGLMHLSVTTETPLIGLFNKTVHPCWRLPKSRLITCIQSDTEQVNHISVNDILNAATKILK